MKRSKSFTLIELVVVIVILGILSAATLSKFINLSKDAKIAVLTQFSESAKVVNRLIFLKSKMPSNVTFPMTGQANLIGIDGNGVIDLTTAGLRLLHSYIDNHKLYKQVNVSDLFKLSGSKVFEEQDVNFVYIGYDANSNNQVSDDNGNFRCTQRQYETVGPKYDVIDDGC
ncbi:type II secretion system protein [Colwellia sp. MB3u-22]|nr:type II secretion system protein [Colwellia sp. MB02u-7]MBA6236862.1 type II secretion system protein [Colwellia sp. MB02u-11]MBA6299998.1 type II secretion system protein [Colwellia sp. MB3u-22]MBA6301845.1 type II secretion system protein [Colwellia sp. MB02u-14]MBA6312683.1 type II secretion system protein [Colwellia sp. MB3u-64]